MSSMTSITLNSRADNTDYDESDDEENVELDSRGPGAQRLPVKTSLRLPEEDSDGDIIKNNLRLDELNKILADEPIVKKAQVASLVRAIEQRWRVKTVLLIWENGFNGQEFSKKTGHVNHCKKCYIPGNLQFIHRKKIWVVIYRLLCTHRTFFRNPSLNNGFLGSFIKHCSTPTTSDTTVLVLAGA